MLNSRVEQSTQTAGTGTVLLDTPPVGRRGFVDAFTTGAVVYYTIENSDGSVWEEGYGVITAGSPDTLTRNAIRSSNGDALVNFGSGTKRVYCAPNADAIRAGSFGAVPSAGGTATALTVAYKPTVKHLRNGMVFRILTTSVSAGGGTTLSVDGGAAWPVVNIHDASDIVANQWRSGQLLNLVFFNNVFALLAAAAIAVHDDAIIGGKSLLSGTSGAGLVLLDRQTASNSTALVFTDIPANYDHYIVSFNHLRPVTSGVYISAQVSRNNGSSFVTSGNYYWQHAHVKANNTTSTVAGSADSAWGLAESVSNTSGGGFCGEMKLYGLGDTTGFKGGTINGEYYDGANFRRSSGGLWINDSAAAVNAFRIYSTSGNLADGTVGLYGLRAA